MSRMCRNCACYVERAHALNPLEKMGFCRLEPVTAQMVRVEKPVLDDAGKVVMSKRDPSKPVTRAAEEIVYFHKATAPAEVCWSWVPVGARPGEKMVDVHLRKIGEAVRPFVEKAMQTLPPEAAALWPALFESVSGNAEADNEPQESSPAADPPAPANDSAVH